MRVWGGLLKYTERGGRGEGSGAEEETDLRCGVRDVFRCIASFEYDALLRKAIVNLKDVMENNKEFYNETSTKALHL